MAMWGKGDPAPSVPALGWSDPANGGWGQQEAGSAEAAPGANTNFSQWLGKNQDHLLVFSPGFRVKIKWECGSRREELPG